MTKNEYVRNGLGWLGMSKQKTAAIMGAIGVVAVSFAPVIASGGHWLRIAGMAMVGSLAVGMIALPVVVPALAEKKKKRLEQEFDEAYQSVWEMTGRDA